MKILSNLFLIAVLGVPVAQATPQAGVAAAVRGTVKLHRRDAVGRAVKSGEPIFLGDEIVSGPDSGMQVLLLDQTVFTLGPDSALVIDRFVYDPASGQGKVDVRMLKGAFRFISGKVAREDPDNMKVHIPAGTIGVRGTIVFVQVDPRDASSLVVLAGPGRNNNAGMPEGHLAVSSAGVTRDVLRAGWGVNIPDRASPPSEPFLVPQAAYSSFAFEVSSRPAGQRPKRGEDGKRARPGRHGGNGSEPAPEGDEPMHPAAHDDGSWSEEGELDGPDGSEPMYTSSDDGSWTEEGGTDGMDGSEPMYMSGDGTGDSQYMSPEMEGSDPSHAFFDGDYLGAEEVSGQYLAEGGSGGEMYMHLSDNLEGYDSFTFDQAQDYIEFQNQLATVNDLASLASTFSGHYFYDLIGVGLDFGSGSFDLLIDLDFSAKQVAFQFQNFNSTTFGTTGLSSAGVSVGFASGFDGFAEYEGLMSYTESGSSCTPCTVRPGARFLNLDGNVAGHVDARAIISDGVTTIGGGIPAVPITSISP